jgi:hypothetical protein
MPPMEPMAAAPSSSANLFKGRSSKLFHPKDAVADWIQTHQSNEVMHWRISVPLCSIVVVLCATVEWRLSSQVDMSYS